MTARSRWLCRWPKLEASAVSQADAAPQEERKSTAKSGPQTPELPLKLNVNERPFRGHHQVVPGFNP